MSAIPRILITAPASGSGKTMITCGILQALKDRNLQPAAFKCGPDYIDPMFHRQVLGIDSYNLDTFMCGKNGIKQILYKHGTGRGISVMEGVMGYYDGIAGISTDASAYDVADTTETPVILIVDCKGRSVSVSAEIKGFLEFRSPSHVEGVILNRLSPMMYDRMKEIIEAETGVKVYGYVPVLDTDMFQSRYLGLKLPEEIAEIKEKLRSLGEQMEKTVDLDGIIELARCAAPLDKDRETDVEVCNREHKLRVAVAQDEAFCFIYRDNLELLETYGIELVPFSPIHDEHLPKDIDGILLYGGYPELYASELSKNDTMRAEIRQAIECRIPCIAECGGFLYLQDNLQGADGSSYPMVGAIPGSSYKTSSLRRFGYITLTGGTVFGQDIGEIRAHEFHYYESEECGHAFVAKKPMSKRSWECMISTETLLTGYPHIHYLGNPKIVEAFCEACRSE